MLFLSHILNNDTLIYTNRNKFKQIKKSDMLKAGIENDTTISTMVYIGTHIGITYYFYQDRQTIKNFDVNFWIFKKPLIVTIYQNELIINKQLINKLNTIKNIGYDILIVKISICNYREDNKFRKENYGFHEDIYDYLVNKFPNIRELKFDSISVSNFLKRMLGKELHKRFLDLQKPILLLENIDLRDINEETKINKIIVSPLRIDNYNRPPRTILGVLID